MEAVLLFVLVPLVQERRNSSDIVSYLNNKVGNRISHVFTCVRGF